MKKILVADDNFLQVDYLIIQLKKKYDVDYVSDGRKAINKIKKNQYDALILDWQMPPKNLINNRRQYYGDNVAKIARKLYPNIPIILRSSVASDFKNELNDINVMCHNKGNDDAKIFNYLDNFFK